MGKNVCFKSKGKNYFYFQNFVDNTQQCFAFTPQATFSASNLSFHWRWRWWDRIQATFYLFFYFINTTTGNSTIAKISAKVRKATWKMEKEERGLGEARRTGWRRGGMRRHHPHHGTHDWLLFQPLIFACQVLPHRDRPRFFDQVGHQTTNASIGNKHFFTK